MVDNYIFGRSMVDCGVGVYADLKDGAHCAPEQKYGTNEIKAGAGRLFPQPQAEAWGY